MRKRLEWEWEELDQGTRRVKVIGGWLVNTHRRFVNGKMESMDQALTFVPDRDHEWCIFKPPAEIGAQLKASDVPY